ncbi:MAG: hypothetical protein ACE5ED_10235 [Rhodothalassiaceae bacterium]
MKSGMPDALALLRRSFVPHDDGYLFYPTRWSGGRFVIKAEFDRMTACWERALGRRALWLLAGFAFLVLLLWSLVAPALEPPAWMEDALTSGLVAVIFGRILWVTTLPWRLVRGRPAIAPPRPAAGMRREMLGVFGWRIVILTLIMTGGLFARTLAAEGNGFGHWLAVAGSAFLFGLSLNLLVHKLRGDG